MNIEPTGHVPPMDEHAKHKTRYIILAIFGPEDEDEFIRYDAASAARLVFVLDNYMMADKIKMRSEPC